MKSHYRIFSLVTLALISAPLSAQDTKPPMKCDCMKKEADSKAAAVEKVTSKSDDLEELLRAMNSSVGSQKIEAMAALLNKMAQNHQAMQKMMESMPKMKKPSDKKPKMQEKLKPSMPPSVGGADADASDPHAGH